VIKMTDKIQRYLNRVGWSTVTILAETFKITRQGVTMVLAEMLDKQDVRIYDGEIVHV